MRYVLDDGTVSAPLSFTTGALPTNVTFPTFTVQQPPGPGTDLTQNTVLHFGIAGYGNVIDTLATDLNGDIDWYYNSVANNFPGFATNLEPGGLVYLIGGQLLDAGEANTLREIDLAGDTVRETNIDAVNAELAALGQQPITDFNHDAVLLPNGDTAVLADTSKTFEVGGKPVALQSAIWSLSSTRTSRWRGSGTPSTI